MVAVREQYKAPPALVEGTELALRVQRFTVSGPWLYKAPPLLLEEAELLLIMLWLIVSVPALKIPPPEPALLPEIVQLLTVNVEFTLLRMPPPLLGVFASLMLSPLSSTV